jgi:hypothetical protein
VCLSALCLITLPALPACETTGLILGEHPAGDAAGVDASLGTPAQCVGCAVTVSGQSDTAVQGGDGGLPYDDTCPGDQVVIGYQGYIVPPQVGITLVGDIQTVCGALSIDSASGDLTTSPGATLPARGTGYGSPWAEMCPTDQVVVGFTGRSGRSLDQLAIDCAPWTVGTDGSVFALAMGTPVPSAPQGGDGGSPYAVLCPAGQLARGSVGQADQWVDAFGLICGTLVLTPAGDP